MPSASYRALEVDGGLDMRAVPGVAIASRGPVHSVILVGQVPWEEMRHIALDGASRTSAALLPLLSKERGLSPTFEEVDHEATWQAVAGDTGALVIGDAAFGAHERFPYVYDLGAEWKAWTGLPFVFAVWAARREARPGPVQEVHRSLLASRAWGLSHLDELAHDAARRTGVDESVCRAYLGDLDYALSYRHLAGLTDFFRRLAQDGLVPDGSLSFISAA